MKNEKLGGCDFGAVHFIYIKFDALYNGIFLDSHLCNFYPVKTEVGGSTPDTFTFLLHDPEIMFYLGFSHYHRC